MSQGLGDLREMTRLACEIASGEVSDEPRSVEGTFPGSRTRAMGHALSLVERLEGAGVSAEREYVGEASEPVEAHRIDIHINGGDGS